MTAVVRGIIIEATGQLAAQLGADFIRSLQSSPSFQISQPHEGAIWISCQDGKWGTWEGQVLSAYYHPTRSHTATTVGRLGQKQSQAAAGRWAISVQTRAIAGNKALYNTI